MNYWILKSEPEEFCIDDLMKQKTTAWDGVRNFQARNNMKMMNLEDIAFFYHSGKKPGIVGICKVIKTAYPDSEDLRFVKVDVEYLEKFPKPLELRQIKAAQGLAKIKLITQPRLSVIPITKTDFDLLKEMLLWP